MCAKSACGAVLVVDDEFSIRQTAAAILRCIGYDVLVAEDGQSAIEQFRTHRDEIGIVLLDYAMPRVDGEGAFYAMRKIDPTARIILVSGCSADDVVDRLLGHGLNAFLAKPYGIQALRETLARVLEQ